MLTDYCLIFLLVMLVMLFYSCNSLHLKQLPNQAEQPTNLFNNGCCTWEREKEQNITDILHDYF